MSQPERKDTIPFILREEFFSDCDILIQKTLPQNIFATYNSWNQLCSGSIQVSSIKFSSVTCFTAYCSISLVHCPCSLWLSWSHWVHGGFVEGQQESQLPQNVTKKPHVQLKKLNFFYMVPIQLTCFILRWPAIYQNTSRICHTRDDVLSFLISHICRNLFMNKSCTLCKSFVLRYKISQDSCVTSRQWLKRLV